MHHPASIGFESILLPWPIFLSWNLEFCHDAGTKAPALYKKHHGLFTVQVRRQFPHPLLRRVSHTLSMPGVAHPVNAGWCVTYLIFALISASQCSFKKTFITCASDGVVLLPQHRVSRSHHVADAEGIQLKKSLVWRRLTLNVCLQ